MEERIMFEKQASKTLSLLMAVCLVLVLTACGASGSSTFDISFENKTEYSLANISIFESGTEFSEADLPEEATALEAGGTMQLSAEAGSGIYDIFCMDNEGDIWVAERVPLSEGVSLSVYMGGEGYPVFAVTDTDGGVTEITGMFNGEAGAVKAPVIPAPSGTDPLDSTYNMATYPGGMSVPYPSTMKVINENTETRTVWLDAVNDPDTGNNISIDFPTITDFDKYFDSGDEEAKVGLGTIFDAVINATYANYYIDIISSEFVNGGTYYSVRQHIWFSSDYFEGGGTAPLRGVLEIRYSGPTGYVLCVLTVADEGGFERYDAVARNIANAIPFGGGWSTAVVAPPPAPVSSGEGRGDYVEEDWSDPGDTGDWSDTGDGEDYDYGEYEIDPWSDAGDTGGEGMGDFFE
jgi:hypothetical protein